MPPGRSTTLDVADRRAVDNQINSRRATPRHLKDKHAAALEKTISKASDASNSGKDFSFGSDDVPPEVKDMSTGHAISA